MSKRILGLLLLVSLLLCTITPAFAITGNDCHSDCDEEYRDTGCAVFLLDSRGKIIGALKPCEDLKILSMQNSKKKSPTGLQNGRAIRRRAFTRVHLDNDYKVIGGGKKLEVTVVLSNLALVQEILGDDFTVADIIDATIYSPNMDCANAYATHMFLPKGSNRVRVGTIYFKSGSYLALYAGNFDYDCDLELGFTAEAVPEPEEKIPGCIEPPDHQGPCCPCHPGCPHWTITTTTTVTVITTVTTTTTIVQGW